MAINGLKDVNHLERFSLQKLQATIQQQEKENHINQELSNSDLKNVIEKNYLMTSPQSKEVCFAIEYKALKKATSNATGEGKIVNHLSGCATLINIWISDSLLSFFL